MTLQPSRRSSPVTSDPELRTVIAPNDMDFGRAAVLADPQGVVFGIAFMNAPA